LLICVIVLGVRGLAIHTVRIHARIGGVAPLAHPFDEFFLRSRHGRLTVLR
jgi:hypothetical protein